MSQRLFSIKTIVALSILLPFLVLSPSVSAAAADGETSDYREAYKRVVPPSPTVSSLCKYGEYPVGNSTGTPDITIPLYTVSCGDLELPITLSYHAGGIKVDETASWVGLGWSLSAGGSIGVTVNGERDAQSWPSGMPSFEDLYTDRAFSDSGMVSKWTIMAWQDMYSRQANGDANPDIYNYNICGRSGQFVHDLNNGNFHEIGGDKNFSFANIGEIPMYAFDRKGNRYDFLAYEDLSSFYSNSKGTEERTYISANNLTCVRSHNGVDSIGLSYTRDWEMVRYKTANPLFYGRDDKSCDAEHLSAYSLKEIHYPTGGYTRFIYEPNNFCCVDNYSGGVVAFCMDGNGQRIKRIENFDGLATTTTQYTYSEGRTLEMPHFASRELYQSWNLEVASEGQSGSAVHDEVYNNAIRIYNEEIRTYLKLSPTPINQLEIAGSDNVSYGEVRETRGDGSFTVSRYSELTERSYNARGFAGYMRDTYCTYYGALDSYYWASGLGLYNNANVSDSRLSAKNGRWGTFFSRGQLVRKTAFDASGRMMLDEKYTYETPYESLHNVVGLDVIQSRVPEVYLKMNDVYDAHVWPVFYANFHYITTGFSRLATKSVTEWRKTPTTTSTSNKAYTGMVTYTTYRYDPDNLITAEETDYLCTEADSLVYDNSVPTVTDDEGEDGEEEADTIQEQEAQTAQHILSHGVYTTYPHTVNKGVYAGMATARMLDYPVERRETVDGNTVSSQLITYKVQGGSYYPDGIYTYTPNAPDGSWTGFDGTTVPSHYGEPDLRIGYTSGRIASLTDKAGTVKSYEWDNRLQYPINETTTGPLGDGAHTRLFNYKAGVGMTGETKENGYRLSYAYDAMCRLASVYDSTGLLTSHSYHFSNNDIGGEGRENSFVDTWTWIDADAGKAIVERQFHDGLGYPTLNSVLGINTTGRAVSTLTEYDECRRTAKVWLPAVGGTAMEGMSQSEYATIARETYSGGEDGDLLYGRYKYDGLGRTTNAYMAGEPWANKCKLERHLANGPDEVKVYGADATTLTANGASFYPPGALQADDERDEDGHRLRVYKDCLGRKVLERRVVVEATSRREGEFNDTYFVYSPTGQLRYVLQPMYQEGGDLRKYAFQYFYDGQGRLSAKVLPGCGRIAYTYDDADRIVAMQDGALRRKGLSRQYEYDGFGRIVRQELSDGTVEIQNCYDGDYSLAHREGIEPAAPHAGNSNGLLTCRRQITSDGGHITEAWYHDGKGRVVESVCKYSSGRVCRNTFLYSFTGKVATHTTVNTASGLSVTTTSANGFDSRSDLLTSTDLSVDINGSTYSKRTAEYGYDLLGRLNSERHGSALQLTEYNLHGWATKLSADNFTEELGYNTGGSVPCYSGNISAVRWRAGTDLFPTQTAMRKYDLAYDKLNRLAQADYTVEGVGFRTDNYSESFGYDANGNITHLMRFGDVDDKDEPFDDTDDLTMDYDGNRLVNVDDQGETFSLSPNFGKAVSVSGDEYTYDGNGAMTGDANRGIALVEYDNLGHPRRVQFASGSATEYVYSADGRKLRTVHTTAVPYVRVAMGQTVELDSSMVLSRNVVDYWDGDIIVRNDTLSALLFDGGYADIKAAGDSCSLKWHYYVKDHLGSVRVVQGEEGTVEQVNHYYPYGNTFGPYNGNDVNPTLQQYKFNGKELDPIHGLGLYDYGARMYDPLTGRWTSVDPMAEKYYHLSPYAMCGNNPINLVDMDGMKIEFASGVSQRFIENFNAAKQLLIEKGVGDVIQRFEKDDKVTVYIAEGISTEYSSEYRHENNTIYWYDNIGLSADNADLSPATILNHEFGHAESANYHYENWKSNIEPNETPFGNVEEENVIKGIEQRTAEALGEVEKGQSTRSSHTGFPFFATSSISNERDMDNSPKMPNVIDEIEIKPRK